MSSYTEIQLEDLIYKIKTLFGNNNSQIILYGSYARGDNTAFSDVDLMILTDLSEIEIAKIEDSVSDVAYDFELDKGIPVSINIKNIDHFSYWADTLPYYNNIIKEGIVLAGC